jgi:FAD/FMN-containing dehydrogenase
LDWVHSLGSISAEHGIGQLKKSGLLLNRTNEELSLMRSIKTIFDPHGIMNPHKIFINPQTLVV